MIVKNNITFKLDQDELRSYSDTVCIIATIASHADAENANDTECFERANKLYNELQDFYACYCDKD